MLNQLTAEYLPLGSKLKEVVENPFYGAVARGIHLSQKISRAQLVRLFPLFGAVKGSGRDTGGRAWYDGLALSAKKRLGFGLQFEGSYTWSETFDMGENYQDYYNFEDSNALSSTEQRHNFIIGYMYELPFGRRKRFGSNWNRAVDAMLGHWQVNGITSYKSGTRLAVTAVNTVSLFARRTNANNNGSSGRLEGSPQSRLAGWFDTTVFSQPAPFTWGNLSPTVSDLRNDGVRNYDLSLFKEFFPTERTKDGCEFGFVRPCQQSSQRMASGPARPEAVVVSFTNGVFRGPHLLKRGEHLFI